MSYPEVAKDTNLHGLGWSTDIAYEEVAGSQIKVTNASQGNLGFLMRNQWYLDDFTAGNPYRSSGTNAIKSLKLMLTFCS